MGRSKDRRADELHRALDDPDERLRAGTAAELARRGDAGALAACVRTIDDNPDAGHLDFTPASRALGAMGLRAVPALLELLLAAREDTRLRAQHALTRIIYEQHGYDMARGFATAAAEDAARSDLRMAGYDFQAGTEEREAAVRRLQRWYERATAAQLSL